MCGRFVSSSPPDELARYFGAVPPDGTVTAPDPADSAPSPASALAHAGSATGPGRSSVSDAFGGPEPAGGFEPNYNVAPSTDVFAVYQDRNGRRVDSLHWGLVPFWAKDVSAGYKMINARADKLAQSSAFRRPFAKRRCLIPADGFYEWRKVPGHRRKQPYFVHRIDDEPLAFAGLWEVWRAPADAPGDGSPAAPGDEEAPAPEDRWLRSCTIITTEANATMAPVHDRMPVILPPSAWEAWLDPDNHDTGQLARLLVPAPEGLLALHPVSLDVSNVRNDGAHLIVPVDTIDPDGKAAPPGPKTGGEPQAVGGRGNDGQATLFDARFDASS